MEMVAKQLLTPKREYRLEEENEIDFAYELKEKDIRARFRVNIFASRSVARPCATSGHRAELEELNLP
jgi:Tfp pilus assembly pilus retraction ATPase PilT